MDVNLDTLLQDWPFRPGEVNVRRVQGADGRPLLQLRIEMGVMQMETIGRPDGARPHGYKNYLTYLRQRQLRQGGEFRFSSRDREEIDREFLQYYHRRLCWLAIHVYRGVIFDAEHTLGLLEWIRQYASDADPKWIESHEQFRPFILAHIARAKANLAIQAGNPIIALREVRKIYAAIHQIYCSYDIEEPLIENDELLVELRQIEQKILSLIDSQGLVLDQSCDDAAACCVDSHHDTGDTPSEDNIFPSQPSEATAEDGLFPTPPPSELADLSNVPESLAVPGGAEIAYTKDTYDVELESLMRKIEYQLHEAIQNENYELAAQLRDQSLQLRNDREKNRSSH
ncbi:MAG: UvrB/UvrC motif-containing protein [Thermoguttaceae bacterium]|nr:UvrB/UvrC motif-containing protein [Thermoguttaceae bacterium]